MTLFTGEIKQLDIAMLVVNVLKNLWCCVSRRV